MPETARETLTTAPQVMESLVRVLDAFIKMLQELKENHINEAAAKEFLEYCKKGGEMYTFFNRDFNEKDFVNCMKRMGCECMTMRCADGKEQGLIMCMFKREDIPYAMIARDMALSVGRQMSDEYGNIMQPVSEISANALNRICKEQGQAVMQFKGLSEVKAKLVMEELRVSGVTFAKNEREEENGKDVVDIYFSENDATRASNALTYANIELKGVSGNHEYRKTAAEMEAVKNAICHIGKDEREFYVVSASNPNNVIHVEDDRIRHYLVGRERETTYRDVRENDHSSMRREYNMMVDQMRKPIILTKQEYNQAKMDPEVMKRLVLEKSAKTLYSDALEKEACFNESFLKNKIKQKTFWQIRAGAFDYDDMLREFESVKNGEVQLSDFLDPALDPTAPKEVQRDAAFRAKEMQDFFSSMSEDDMKFFISFTEDCIKEYGRSERQVDYKVFEPEELAKSLDDLISNVENDRKLSDLNNEDILPEIEENIMQPAENGGEL